MLASTEMTKKLRAFLLGLVGVISISFLGGLIVSIIGHYSKNREFGYSFFIPTVFVALAIIYYLFYMVKAILHSRQKK